MDSKEISKAGDLAEKHFENGLLCAESVVMSLASVQDVESGHLPKIASVFCSGMSRSCGTCGALTGAMMGLSLKLGRSGSGQSIEPGYAATQQLIHRFEQEFGGRDCKQLLGCDISTEQGMQQFRERQLITQCRWYTRRAAEIAVSVMGSHSGNTKA